MWMCSCTHLCVRVYVRSPLGKSRVFAPAWWMVWMVWAFQPSAVFYKLWVLVSLSWPRDSQPGSEPAAGRPLHSWNKDWESREWGACSSNNIPKYLFCTTHGCHCAMKHLRIDFRIWKSVRLKVLNWDWVWMWTSRIRRGSWKFSFSFFCLKTPWVILMVVHQANQ